MAHRDLARFEQMQLLAKLVTCFLWSKHWENTPMEERFSDVQITNVIFGLEWFWKITWAIFEKSLLWDSKWLWFESSSFMRIPLFYRILKQKVSVQVLKTKGCSKPALTTIWAKASSPLRTLCRAYPSGVAFVSRIDEIIGLFCKIAL